MSTPSTSHSPSLFSTWQRDLPASLVVFLVALPLCLGIAMASGAPLVSGLIAGVVGGIVVGALSKSPLSVSGPAAGLTVIVLDAITTLPTYEAFLLAVCLAGLLQVALGLCRGGTISNFVPSYVIHGLLSAIGIILILKQIPHAFGYDGNFEGDEAFVQSDGQTTFSSLMHLSTEHLSLAAICIAFISIVFLFWWDKKQPKLENWLRYVPGPLIVVLFGVAANLGLQSFLPAFAISAEHMVAVPVTETVEAFFGQFRFPDMSHLGNMQVWSAAIVIALVASIESLLSVEAIDKLDPERRHTPPNRELFAQGAGNFFSGLIGGIPVTSVIIRSTANVSANAGSKLSTILHGVLLMVCVAAIPKLLNLIPLSALAAILIALGYKLAKPEIFIEKYRRGMRYFMPFIATVIAIVLTDPLLGIGIGLAFGILFVLIQSFYNSISIHEENGRYVIRCQKDLFFLHKHQLKNKLNSVPDGAQVVLDLSRVHFMDKDNIDMINDFAETARQRGVHVLIRPAASKGLTQMLDVPHESMVAQ